MCTLLVYFFASCITYVCRVSWPDNVKECVKAKRVNAGDIGRDSWRIKSLIIAIKPLGRYYIIHMYTYVYIYIFALNTVRNHI